MRIQLTILGILLTVAIYAQMPGQAQILAQTQILPQAQIPAQTLPDFEFYRLDKSPFTNKDLPQRKRTFFVFFDSDCEHCQRAVKKIDQQYKSFKNTLTCLVSLDDHDKINRFINTYAPHLKDQANVVLLQDIRNQFIVRFKPYKYPSMFLYSADKKLVDYEDNEETVFRMVNALAKTNSHQ
jgi:peroxiredoxin